MSYVYQYCKLLQDVIFLSQMQFWSFGLMQQIKAHHLVKSLPKSLVKWETDTKKTRTTETKITKLDYRQNICANNPLFIFQLTDP